MNNIFEKLLHKIENSDDYFDDMELTFTANKSEKLIDLLYFELNIHKLGKDVGYNKAFERIVGTMLMSLRYGGKWIRYSRDNNAYAKKQNRGSYDNKNITNMRKKDLIEIVELLEKGGLVRHIPGNKNVIKKEENYQSRFIPTRKFYNLAISSEIDFINRWDVVVEDFDEVRYKVRYMLEKENIDKWTDEEEWMNEKISREAPPFIKGEDFKRLDDDLNRLNKNLEKHAFEFALAGELRNCLLNFNKFYIPAGPFDARLQQVYTNCPEVPKLKGTNVEKKSRSGRGTPFQENICSGGRYYNQYQNIPSDFRQFMVIDGDNCIEYDFDSHHLRLLYAITKTPFPEPNAMQGITSDFYSIGVSNAEIMIFFAMAKDLFKIGDNYPPDKLFRKIVKQISLRVINCGKDNNIAHNVVRQWKHSNKMFQVGDDLQAFLTDMVKKIVEGIIERHAGVSDYFFKKGLVDGRDMMNHDKDITRKIMEIVLIKHGVGIFQLHDSYLVPFQHGDLLQDTMKNVYFETYGVWPGITQKEYNPIEIIAKKYGIDWQVNGVDLLPGDRVSCLPTAQVLEDFLPKASFEVAA